MVTLPALPYAYDALEPHISGAIMRLHHQKHHQTYVDKVNEAIEQAPQALQEWPVETLLARLDEVPEVLRQALRNNGGGHYNHSLFWQMLSPDGGGAPQGRLLEAIERQYGSFDAFKVAFSEQASAVFGSGWVWLQPDLTIVRSSNQDSPIMQGQAEPLLGLDVWEHAYYLDYKNVRPDYIAAWWNVVHWRWIEQRYERVVSGD